MRLKILFCCVYAFGLSVHAQVKIRIDNINPRTDINGDTIDLHDGRVIKFGELFYWYGTSYGNTSGFVRTNHYQCYSSPDMMTWKKEGLLLEDQPSGIYYRPHVIYNAKTGKYVLWYNWYPKLWNGKFGVATSDSPSGPFKIVNNDVEVAHTNLGVGDFGLFVDDDQTAYIIYNTIQGHQNSVERLNDDYLSSSMENGGFIATGCEAGAIFKRDNLYYLLTDYTCCFCTQGSGARVYVSENPLSGYERRNNINRYPGTPADVLIDGIKAPNIYARLIKNEDNSFSPAQIDFSRIKTFNRVDIWIFTGNRSSMCGDTLAQQVHDNIVTPEFELLVRNGCKWEKIETDVIIERTSVFNKISLRIETVNSSSVLLKPLSSFPYKYISVNEIKVFNEDEMISASDKGTQAFINDINPENALPIIPAQQTYVMPLKTTKGIQFIWMGDLWGSASDNIKGHDYQYWGSPLEFDAEGNILPMKWTDEWQIEIVD